MEIGDLYKNLKIA